MKDKIKHMIGGALLSFTGLAIIVNLVLAGAVALIDESYTNQDWINVTYVKQSNTSTGLLQFYYYPSKALQQDTEDILLIYKFISLKWKQV